MNTISISICATDESGKTQCVQMNIQGPDVKATARDLATRFAEHGIAVVQNGLGWDHSISDITIE